MRIHEISGLASGRLAIAGRPRGGDRLDVDLALLRREGFTTLASALTREEESELELSREHAVAAAAGLLYRSLPIPDRGLPIKAVIEPALIELAGLIKGGASVAVHCRMGIGRSSLICASILRLGGASASDAFVRIEAARGLAVPDTDAQRAWVEDFNT
jgi:protein-tyrosine phosphatase